jgi:hypothetical protein
MSAVLRAGDLDPRNLPELVGQIPNAGGLGSPPVRIWAEGADGWAFDFWRGLEDPIGWCAAGQEPTELTGRTVLERAESGRIFAPEGELRWRLVPADSPDTAAAVHHCRLVFLGMHDWFPSSGLLAPRTELDQLSRHESELDVLLWGQQTEHTPGEWIELRIPHRFRYPVSEVLPEGTRGAAVGPFSSRPHPRSRVRLRTEIWVDRWGTPHFMRLCDLLISPIKD